MTYDVGNPAHDCKDCAELRKRVRELEAENESLGVTQDQHRLAATRLRQDNKRLHQHMLIMRDERDVAEARLRTAREALGRIDKDDVPCGVNYSDVSAHEYYKARMNAVMDVARAALRDMGDVPDAEPTTPCPVCGHRPTHWTQEMLDGAKVYGEHLAMKLRELEGADCPGCAAARRGLEYIRDEDISMSRSDGSTLYGYWHDKAVDTLAQMDAVERMEEREAPLARIGDALCECGHPFKMHDGDIETGGACEYGRDSGVHGCECKYFELDELVAEPPDGLTDLELDCLWSENLGLPRRYARAVIEAHDANRRSGYVRGWHDGLVARDKIDAAEPDEPTGPTDTERLECEQWELSDAPEMSGMTVEKIVEAWLKANGFDGLCEGMQKCGCAIGELMPCGEPRPDCEPAHQKPDESGEYDFVMVVPPKEATPQPGGPDAKWTYPDKCLCGHWRFNHDSSDGASCLVCGCVTFESSSKGGDSNDEMSA